MTTVRRPQEITLFSRPLCGWCPEAKAWLDARGWSYHVHDVGADPAARLRAMELSGQPRVPVIEVDGAVLGDFDVDQLEAFLVERGYLKPH